MRRREWYHMSDFWARVFEGLRVSGFGLLGVFSVLIVFYVVIILLDKIKEKPEAE